MWENYPHVLRKINLDGLDIEKRFLQASLGWMRYKPLWLYIKDTDNYEENIQKCFEKLENSVPQMNKLFNNLNFEEIIEEFTKYNDKVEQHYQDYLRTNEIWNKIKAL